MKKIILLLIVTAFVVGCDSKPDKNNVALKKEIISSCEKEAIKKGMPESKKALLREYCSCSTEKITGEFTYAEMLQIQNPTPELKSKMQKLTEPCMKDLTNSLDEMDKKKKK